MSEPSNQPALYPLKKAMRPPIPEAFKGILSNLVEKACVQELIDYWIEERARIGLPERPPTAQGLPEALEETRKLMENTDLAEKVEQAKKVSRGET
ncbi:MAG: hypothetical protein QW057_10620, partial [Candidatus Bathyarchaeia archaeon]